MQPSDILIMIVDSDLSPFAFEELSHVESDHNRMWRQSH